MHHLAQLSCVVTLLHLILPTIEDQGGIVMLQAEKNERKYQSVPGCWLGNDFHMLGDKWSPIIQPYGRMNCVKCQCARVVRKGVIQQDGMVVCRNIKRECPDVNCRNPVLRPATCCKVCPFSDNGFWEDNYNLLQGDDVTSVSKYEVNNKLGLPDMSALLVGGNVIRHTSRKTRAAAIMHVTFISHSAFHYVVRYARLKGPQMIKLTDEYGTVFLERPIKHTMKGRGKICGVWTDIPPVYIQYILQDRMMVTIATKRQKKGEISGRLNVDNLPEKGTFEAVLTSPQKTGIGGSAVVYYDVISRSASYVIKVEGSMGKAGSNEYFVNMEKDTEIVYQDILRMSTTNQLVGKLKLDTRMSKRMARGRLKLRVTARSGETILGTLMPRVTCKSRLGIIKAGRSNRGQGRGYIATQLHENGTLHYKAMLNDVTSEVTRLTLERYMPRLERWRTMAVLTHAYTQDVTSYAGQAIGVHTKLRTIDVIALQDGQLRFAMETGSRDVVYAELLDVPYMEAIDVFTHSPVYLTSDDCDVDFYAWLQLDRACALNYYITTSASVDIFTWPPTKYNFEARLHASTSGYDYPILYDVNSTDIQIRDMYGTVEDVPPDLLQDLHFGEAVIKVEVTDSMGCSNLQAKVHRHNTCWGQKVRRDDRFSNEVDGNGVFRCYYEGHMYNHGESWLPEASYPCHTCRCERGNVFCDKVLCPPVSCANPVKHEDQCCPLCEDDNSTEKRHQGSCYYHGDKRWHPVGTYWHPYVPPFGYAKCAVCNCLPGSSEVNCTRLPCPKVQCPRSQRVRVNRDDCCQVCVETASAPLRTADVYLKDDVSHEDCKVGEETYAGGTTWHPNVEPFGEMKCYTCRCRRGKVRCKKKICKKLKCKRTHRLSGECCPFCYHEKNKFTRKGRHKKYKKKMDMFA